MTFLEQLKKVVRKNQDLFTLFLNEINKLESNGFRVDLNFYLKHPASIIIYWGKQNDN